MASRDKDYILDEIINRKFIRNFILMISIFHNIMYMKMHTNIRVRFIFLKSLLYSAVFL